MKGDRIIARAFGGKPFVGRVWDATVRAVHICTEEDYQLLVETGHGSLVGAPRKDVFEYDPVLLATIQEHWQTDPSVWERAMPWLGDIDEPPAGGAGR